MSRVKSPKHPGPHKFIKLNGKNVRAWRCAKPDCHYLVHHSQEEIISGRKSECWGCGIDFIMTEINLTQEMPSCNNCRLKEHTDGKVDVNALDAYLRSKSVNPTAPVETPFSVPSFSVPNVKHKSESAKAIVIEMTNTKEPEKIEVYEPNDSDDGSVI